MDVVKIQFETVGPKLLSERGWVVIEADSARGIKHAVVVFGRMEEVQAAIERAMREAGVTKE